MGGGVTVKDVPAHDFIMAYAAFLKKSGKIEVPQWADLVKTGRNKELGPLNPDWFYVRTAAVARHVYTRPQVGVGAMRKTFGGKRRNGVCPGHKALASGSILRNAFKQLEKVKVVEKAGKGGRQMTSSGQRDLDRIASQVATALKKN